MSKFEQVYEIQKQYRRGQRSYSDAIKGIKQIFYSPVAKITDEYVDWLLNDYNFNQEVTTIRKVENDICWTNYCTDTQENAIAWYKELTGQNPSHDTILFFRGMYNFRIHK